MYYESTKKKKGDRDEAPQRARYVSFIRLMPFSTFPFPSHSFSFHFHFILHSIILGMDDRLTLYPRSLENQIIREGERDLYIKLTYSVYRTDDADASASTSADGGSSSKDKRKPRKWHLSAYMRVLPSYHCSVN